MTTQMPNTAIREATGRSQLQNCFPVIQELRPHLTEEFFIQQVQRQHHQGYHLMYVVNDQKVVSILGYRLTEHLAWGKVLYIDDFATHSSVRGQGYGRILMRWAIEKARIESCNQVHLDTGTQRHEAHRFYLSFGFKLTSLHMMMKLD